MPSIGNPGRCLEIVEIAFKAWGLVAFPDTPPYVVDLLRPTAGHGVASACSPINPDIVLIAVMPSALPLS